MSKKYWKVALVFCCCGMLFVAGAVQAAEMRIVTLSVQRVVNECRAGKEAQKSMEGKMVDLQADLQKEQQKLTVLKDEMEKKSSVWSEETKKKKERDYQKDVRDFQVKSDDARYELKQLENTKMRPILQELEKVIKDIGPREKYTLILDNTPGRSAANGLLYADKNIDITDRVIQLVDAQMPAGAAKEQVNSKDHKKAAPAAKSAPTK